MNKHSVLLLSLVTFVRGRRSACFLLLVICAAVQGTIIVLSVILIYAANCYDYGDTSIWYFAGERRLRNAKNRNWHRRRDAQFAAKSVCGRTPAQGGPTKIGGAAAIKRVTWAIPSPVRWRAQSYCASMPCNLPGFDPEKSNGKGGHKTKMLDMSIVWHCHYAAIPLKLLHWYAPCVYTVIFLNTSGHRINHIIMWILRSPKRTSNNHWPKKNHQQIGDCSVFVSARDSDEQKRKKSQLSDFKMYFMCLITI